MLRSLKSVSIEGWIRKRIIAYLLHPYFSIKDVLSVCDGLVFKVLKNINGRFNV